MEKIFRTGLLQQQIATRLAAGNANKSSSSKLAGTHQTQQKPAPDPHADAAAFILNAGQPGNKIIEVKK